MTFTVEENSGQSTNIFLPDLFLTACLSKNSYSLINPTKSFSRQTFPIDGEFFFTKVPVANLETMLHLQQLGFFVTDTNIRLRCSTSFSGAKLPIELRVAHPSDRSAVERLATESFIYDRFHNDPYIDDWTASIVKKRWVSNFFVGKRGDWLLVAEDDDGIQGFCLLTTNSNDTLIIDLIAVSKSKRKKGIAQSMISYASTVCLPDLNQIEVGTQIANTPSLALYLNLGFTVCSASYVLHLHLEQSA